MTSFGIIPYNSTDDDNDFELSNVNALKKRETVRTLTFNLIPNMEWNSPVIDGS